MEEPDQVVIPFTKDEKVKSYLEKEYLRWKACDGDEVGYKSDMIISVWKLASRDLCE